MLWPRKIISFFVCSQIYTEVGTCLQVLDKNKDYFADFKKWYAAILTKDILFQQYYTIKYFSAQHEIFVVKVLAKRNAKRTDL